MNQLTLNILIHDTLWQCAKSVGLQPLQLFVIKRLSQKSTSIFFSFSKGYMLTILTNIDISLFLTLFFIPQY